MDIMRGKYRIEWHDGVLQLLAQESQAAVEQTIAHYYATLTDSPADAKIRYNLGQLFRREGRLQDARREYGKAAELQVEPWSRYAAHLLKKLASEEDRLRWTIFKPVVRVRLWPRRKPNNDTRRTIHPLPEGEKLSFAILAILEAGNHVVSYRDLLHTLDATPRILGWHRSEQEINLALYELWRQNYISSPGVRWLPERPATVDGIFDDPSWHGMEISLMDKGVAYLHTQRAQR